MQETLIKKPPAQAEQPTVLELEQRPAQLPAVAQQQAESGNPFRAVEIAVERGMSPEVIEKLIASAERMEQMRERERSRHAELAFRRDFADFKGENVIILKSKRVDRGRAGSFNQAEFDKVCGMLSPPLSRHGFGFRHDQKFAPWRDDDGKAFLGADGMPIPWVYVTCFLEHRDGFREVLELNGPPGDTDANSLVQNQQVTASILKRQSLLAITGTPTAEEDDESRLKRNQQAEGKREEFDELLDAGRASAIDGSKALTAWWAALNNKQRSLMNKEFAQLRKDAAANDKPVDHSKEAARA